MAFQAFGGLLVPAVWEIPVLGAKEGVAVEEDEPFPSAL